MLIELKKIEHGPAPACPRYNDPGSSFPKARPFHARHYLTKAGAFGFSLPLLDPRDDELRLRDALACPRLTAGVPHKFFQIAL